MFAVTGWLLFLALTCAEIKALSTPTPASSTTKPVKQCSSATLVDMYAVVDSSGSIGKSRFKFNGQFLAKLIQGFYMRKVGIKFALCTFGTSVKPQWNLTSNKTFMEENLAKIPYQGSTTNTHLGLLWVIRSGVSTVKQGARRGAKKVVLVVTDGKSGSPDLTLQAAKELKKAGFTILVLAVGNQPDEQEIQGIASKPEYVVKVHNYESLDYFVSNASDIVCNDAKPPPPPPVKNCQPDTLIDIYGVIDASGSIGKAHFKYNGLFLKRLIKGYTLSQNGTKFALCTFSDRDAEQWGLSSNKSFIEERLDHLPYQSSATNTHLGLLWVTKSNVSTVERGARPGAKEVVLVVTDGKSGRPPKTQKAADDLKSLGFIVIVLGVGDELDEQEINAMASSPTFVVKVENYESLDYYASLVSDIICNAAPFKQLP